MFRGDINNSIFRIKIFKVIYLIERKNERFDERQALFEEQHVVVRGL